MIFISIICNFSSGAVLMLDFPPPPMFAILESFFFDKVAWDNKAYFNF